MPLYLEPAYMDRVIGETAESGAEGRGGRVGRVKGADGVGRGGAAPAPPLPSWFCVCRRIFTTSMGLSTDRGERERSEQVEGLQVSRATELGWRDGWYIGCSVSEGWTCADDAARQAAGHHLGCHALAGRARCRWVDGRRGRRREGGGEELGCGALLVLAVVGDCEGRGHGDGVAAGDGDTVEGREMMVVVRREMRVVSMGGRKRRAGWRYELGGGGHGGRWVGRADSGEGDALTTSALSRAPRCLRSSAATV